MNYAQAQNLNWIEREILFRGAPISSVHTKISWPARNLMNWKISINPALLIKYMSIVKKLNQPYIVSIKFISIVKENNFDNLTRNVPAEKYDRNVHMNL